jgi:putative ABC transport system permease protein
MLNRKLLRDLRRMGGQVVTIAVVIGCGIAILVAAVATYQSLLATQEDYYRRGRFADVFASVKRAPEALAARLSEIPGIGVLETRVAEDVTITLPGAGEPLTAHIVSLPDEGTALLNRLYLREGRPIESGTTEEVLVGEAFATANNLRPGGTLTAILNGPPQAIEHRGNRAVSGIRVRDEAGRPDPRRCPLRHHVDGPQGSRIGLRHGRVHSTI